MNLITFIDYFGTFVFALSGVMAGVEKKFDIFGAIILGMVTAIGGGTLRDLLIGSTPVGWMLNPVYVYIILSALPVSWFFGVKMLSWRKSFFVFDTVGIGLFTILGMEKTLQFGLSPVIAIMMGVVSAVFGGVIRDVLSNEVPLIFRKEIYASACLAGAISYYGILQITDRQRAMIASIGIVIVIRYFAIKKHWRLPLRVRE